LRETEQKGNLAFRATSVKVCSLRKKIHALPNCEKTAMLVGPRALLRKGSRNLWKTQQFSGSQKKVVSAFPLPIDSKSAMN
jgi:hypothetical protein